MSVIISYNSSLLQTSFTEEGVRFPVFARSTPHDSVVSSVQKLKKALSELGEGGLVQIQ